MSVLPFVRVCVFACVCVRACVCLCVYVYVRVCGCACVYERMEGRKKYIWADPPGLCDSVLCAECLTRVHKDSTRLACETPQTQSGKARLVTYGLLLAMASKRVRCSPFLQTTESDSYIERDNHNATDKERENERENILQRDRA